MFHSLPLKKTPQTTHKKPKPKPLPKKTTVKTIREGLIKSVNFLRDSCTFGFPIL